jgi:type VI secretion system protein ImpB
MSPELNFKVENTLAGDGSEMSVQLKFNAIEDFEPAKIVAQIEPLKKLLDARNQLRDLLTKADRSEELESILEKILKNQDDLAKLSKDLGIDQSTDNESAAK